MTTDTYPAHTTAARRPPSRAPMDPMRKTSLTAGILYLITFVSMPTLALYKPVKDHVDTFILGAGGNTGVLWGALSELVVGLAGIGTAVVLYPVTKRISQIAGLALVTFRILETSLIFVGVVSVLSIITLRTDVAGTAGADPAALVTTGHSLVAIYNRTFLVSQSLMPAFCDLLLGYLLYRSGLVPRVLPILALAGGPMLITSDIAIYFGAYNNLSPLAALGTLPVAVFEFSLGIYLTVKGFRPAAVAALPPAQAVR
jgi:hypothetical protein